MKSQVTSYWADPIVNRNLYTHPESIASVRSCNVAKTHGHPRGVLKTHSCDLAVRLRISSQYRTKFRRVVL